VVLILALFFGLTKLEPKTIEAGSFINRFRILTQERFLIALFIATALAVGVEIGTLSILTTFLMELRGFTQITSKIGLIVFLVGMAAGRLVLGYLTRKEQQIPHFVLALFGLSFLVYTGLFLTTLDGLTYVAIFAAGLSLSALLPLMITMAGLRYQEVAGTVLGGVKVAAGLGGILLPLFMSLLARSISFQASLLVFPSALLLAFVVLSLQLRHIGSLESAVIANRAE
jgi:fucose permease